MFNGTEDYYLQSLVYNSTRIGIELFISTDGGLTLFDPITGGEGKVAIRIAHDSSFSGNE